MDDDLYVRLLNRLNQNATKMPLIDPVMNFLKAVFTEEQAALGAAFPLGAHTLAALAVTLQRDEKGLERLLEEMADEGLIFVAKTDEGTREYSLSPFVPGILEFQYVKDLDSERVRHRHRLIREIHEAVESLTEKRYRELDPARKKPRTPGLRTVAVEEQLPGNTAIATWEQMTEIIDREASFAVVPCPCRLQAQMNGTPCRIEDAPRESCIYFGKVADYMVERRFARRLSRKELLETLKACEKAGLVHNISNFLGDQIVLCNCCGCCCPTLKQMKKFRGLELVMRSNFVATIDESSCVGCGACVERCQLEALTVENDVAVVNADFCLGCGNCVAQCPSGSLSLTRCSENKPPQRKATIVGLGI